MAIQLASLFIELAADGGPLTAELNNTANQTRNWSKQIGKAADKAKASFAAVTVGVGLASAALTAMYVTTGRTLDSLGKTAAKLGDTTEDLRVFGLAAEYGGVGADSANVALQRMTRRLAEAALGSGEAKGAIAELGLDAERLAKMRPSAAFEEIAAALGTIPNASDRVRLAMKFFDSEGVALVNVTRDVLQQAKDDMDALNGAVTSIEVAQIEAANDSITRLGTGFNLVTEKLTAKMAPAVKEVADQLFSSATQGTQLDGVLDRLVLGALDGFATLTEVTGKVLGFFDGREEVATYGVIGYMLFGKKGLFLGAALGSVSDSLKETFDVVRISFDDSATALEKTTAEIERLEAKLALRKTPGFDLIFGDEGDANIEARLEFLKEKQLQLQSFAASSIAALAGPDSLARIGQNALEALSATTRGLIDNYGELGEAVAAANLIVPTELNSPTGAGNTQIVEPEPYVVNGITVEDDPAANDPDATTPEEDELARKAEFRATYFAAQIAEEKRFQNTLTLFAESGSKDRLSILFKETSGALATLSQSSRTMFEVNKAFGLADATVSIATGIASSLKVGGWAGFGMAAKVALEGAAQISTITKAKYGKGDVSSPGQGGASPVTDVSSAGSNIAANDPAVQNGVAGNQGGGGVQIFGFHTPGASDEQKADEYAMWLQEAQDADLLVPDGNGRLQYTGTGTGGGYQRPEYTQIA